MPQTMSDEELEKALPTAVQIDEYSFRDETNEDDYFTAFLYKTPDSRHFRHIQSSGFGSYFCGAGNIGQWLTDDELADWHDH